jgi:hypothetical protein
VHFACKTPELLAILGLDVDFPKKAAFVPLYHPGEEAILAISVS